MTSAEDWLNRGARTERFIRSRCSFRLRAANIGIAKQHRARQVGLFNAVQIDDHDLLKPKQGKILENFVPQGAGSDHQDAGRANLRFIPPGNESKPAIPVFAANRRQRF